MTNKLSFRGNREIWSLPKTAYLSSDRFSAGSVLKSYDWAAEMKKQERCVISGFHSKLEKDVFDLLLLGKQPIIMALARSMYEKTPPNLKPHIDAGRLLVVSQFEPGSNRVTRDLAYLRNQFVIDNSIEVVYAHIYEGGMLEQLKVRDEVLVRVLDRE